MSSAGSSNKYLTVEYISQAKKEESSEEPLMEEWSSLNISDENIKQVGSQKSLFDYTGVELCSQYICMSTSSILRLPYYKYPAVLDPGIKRALFDPESKLQYPDDGQELYLTLCKKMNQCPVRLFHRRLLEEVINLSYYCINPNGLRAISLALQYNRFVKVLDLTDNFLNHDSCYHLSEMFSGNSSLRELILSGCRIGHEGVRILLSGLHFNGSLKELNLNRNLLGNIGMQHVAQSVFLGLDVQKLHLSNNNIGAKGIIAFTEALDIHNKFILLDLSWNHLYVPATYRLLNTLGESKTLQVCDLSWNAISNPSIGLAIKSLTSAPKLHTLNLSNNKLAGEAIINLLGNLGKAKKLVTLDLSYNPLSTSDALKVIMKLKLPAVRVRRLFLDNVSVNANFLEIREQIKCIKSKHDVVVTYGKVIGMFTPKVPDMRELVLNRAEYITKRPKKNRVDIALIVFQLLKDNKLIMTAKDFMTAITNSGAPLDEDLLTEIVCTFPGPSSGKAKTVDMKLLANFIQRKWPERKLPPTPPPELEPEPIIVLKSKKEKGIKGKK